jgi:predicted Fe-S protein YdhL (DUF1289 family)
MTNPDQKIADRTQKPLSPCLLICTLDDNKQCLGCGRTLTQISQWALMSVAEQWEVMDALDVQKCANDATIASGFGD